MRRRPRTCPMRRTSSTRLSVTQASSNRSWTSCATSVTRHRPTWMPPRTSTSLRLTISTAPTSTTTTRTRAACLTTCKAPRRNLSAHSAPCCSCTARRSSRLQALSTLASQTWTRRLLRWIRAPTRSCSATRFARATRLLTIRLSRICMLRNLQRPRRCSRSTSAACSRRSFSRPRRARRTQSVRTLAICRPSSAKRRSRSVWKSSRKITRARSRRLRAWPRPSTFTRSSLSWVTPRLLLLPRKSTKIHRSTFSALLNRSTSFSSICRPSKALLLPSRLRASLHLPLAPRILMRMKTSLTTARRSTKRKRSAAASATMRATALTLPTLRPCHSLLATRLCSTLLRGQTTASCPSTRATKSLSTRTMAAAGCVPKRMASTATSPRRTCSSAQQRNSSFCARIEDPLAFQLPLAPPYLLPPC
eukprot:m.296850 g.296850  ORF g.296850 m.296850 type:complete len:420 (-) comp13475_c0_seq1:918-2177(-)